MTSNLAPGAGNLLLKLVALILVAVVVVLASFAIVVHAAECSNDPEAENACPTDANPPPDEGDNLPPEKFFEGTGFTADAGTVLFSDEPNISIHWEGQSSAVNDEIGILGSNYKVVSPSLKGE